MSSLKLWDCECDKCKTIFEDWADGVTAPLCPHCGSAFTRILPGGTKFEKAKDPYDYLEKCVPGPSVTVGPHKNKGKK